MGADVGSTYACAAAQVHYVVWITWRRDMIKFIKLLRNSDGATAIEYGLIAALIAVAAIGAMQGVGSKLNTTFNNVGASLI